MAQTHADLIANAEAMLDTITGFKRVFGAPGEHGYDTPEGQALYRLYEAQVGLHSALVRARAARHGR